MVERFWARLQALRSECKNSWNSPEGPLLTVRTPIGLKIGGGSVQHWKCTPKGRKGRKEKQGNRAGNGSIRENTGQKGISEDELWTGETGEGSCHRQNRPWGRGG